MQLSTDVGALDTRRRGLADAWTTLVEMALVLAAMALLLPAFAAVAAFGEGREQRFADTGWQVAGLPEPTLPATCALVGARAEALVRERLCTPFSRSAPESPPLALPPVLEQAAVRAGQALLAPLQQAQARLDGLRSRPGEAESGADVRATAYAVASIEAEIQPYVDRYRLTPSDPAGAAPLGCALRWVQASLADPAALPQALQPMAHANALLLLAAAIDGRSATAPLAATALLPPSAAPSPACNGGAVAALSATATVLRDARQSQLNARKNEAMRALLQSAGAQWAGAMLLGYGLLLWSRRPGAPAFGIAAALALWALAAWWARVPWPFAGQRGFEPARLEPVWPGKPAAFVLVLLAGAALALLWAAVHRFRRAPAAPPQTMSSRLAYPGLVCATGLGALLLLDLSAHGHPVNRYLALYHQGHLWLGMLVFSLVLFLRPGLAHGLGWWLSIAGESARRAARRLGRIGAAAAGLLLTGAALLAFGLALSNQRQLTSELGRIWLIVGAAWFFFLRAGPLAERIARAGPAALSFGRYLGPLLFVVAVLVAAMFVTRDMGPLLIAGYASGAFVAASLAVWWHLRSGRVAGPFALAVGFFATWIGAVTWALFELGNVDRVTAARLESLAAPLASTNDQAALVAWFQRAIPVDGFGLGAVPWCGFAAAGSCSGVPAQIHSDYTFTAIYGVFGPLAAWAAAIGCAVWLHRLVRHHGRVTRGEPRFVIATGGHLANDGQALLSWLGVAWVALTLCQLAVTVAGNLALLPLTGVTFPFVSFGMTSLLVNLAFLALCLNVDLPARGGAGGGG